MLSMWRGQDDLIEASNRNGLFEEPDQNGFIETCNRDDLNEIEQALNAAAMCDGMAFLRQAHALLPGRLATVAPFGAESAVLLSDVADVDSSFLVVFLQIDTHFEKLWSIDRSFRSSSGRATLSTPLQRVRR